MFHFLSCQIPSELVKRFLFHISLSIKSFQSQKYQNSVTDTDWISWFTQLSQELVLHSKSAAIRACNPLLPASLTLCSNLFPLTMVSIWENANVDERMTLSQYFSKFVQDQKTPRNVLDVISSACDALNRAGFSFFSFYLAGYAAENSQSWFRAIRFYELALPENPNSLRSLLRIHAQLKRKDAALGLLSVLDEENCELYEDLGIWAKARDLYQKQLNENQNSKAALVGLLRCSSELEDWEAIGERFKDFYFYDKELQKAVGVYFAVSARLLHSNPEPFYNSYDPYSCFWRALHFIDIGDLHKAEFYINHGLRILCHEMTPFYNRKL